MFLTRHQVDITTDASGDGTGYTPNVNGMIHSIQYVKDDYADGVDFAITGAVTGIAILTDADCNASETFYPRRQVNDVADGALLTFDGSNKNVVPVGVVGERVKIVVSSGGNTTSGTFYVTVEGN